LPLPKKKRLQFDLGNLILVLSALTALVMLINSFFASYRVQRELLIDNALEANHVYAAKLASSTDAFLQASLQQLAYSARLQSSRFDDSDFLHDEAERLLEQTASFNSVFVVSNRGTVLAASPASLHLVGQTLSTEGVKEAMRTRKATISRPYMSAANNLVVVVSQPVFTADGEYLGFVGGSFYLKRRSILNELLGEHYYKDGSYLYVVDSNRRLLYHPDRERIGTIVTDNALVDRLPKEDSGTQRVINSQGVDMLAGFAVVPTTRWGIIAQRPTETTIASIDELMVKVILTTAPMALLSFVLIWWLARIIARPLWQLSAGARDMADPGTADSIRSVRAWYFEAAALKRALVLGLNLLHERIGKLNHAVQTDPLTGLHNRRGLEFMLSLWQAENRAFSVITLDIDHFKRVNDTHGHDVGDKVINNVAELMRGCSRENDILCRTGGEEFLMLLPGTNTLAATAVAERLRHTVEQADIPPAGHITISLGVAAWIPGGPSPSLVLKSADEQLYAAKAAGRNCVRVDQAGTVIS
jgi:diguanylate cyclase (GGDEF)-like protein